MGVSDIWVSKHGVCPQKAILIRKLWRPIGFWGSLFSDQAFTESDHITAWDLRWFLRTQATDFCVKISAEPFFLMTDSRGSFLGDPSSWWMCYASCIGLCWVKSAIWLRVVSTIGARVLLAPQRIFIPFTCCLDAKNQISLNSATALKDTSFTKVRCKDAGTEWTWTNSIRFTIGWDPHQGAME